MKHALSDLRRGWPANAAGKASLLFIHRAKHRLSNLRRLPNAAKKCLFCLDTHKTKHSNSRSLI